MLAESDGAEHMTLYRHQDKDLTNSCHTSCSHGNTGDQKPPVQIDEPLDENRPMCKLQSLSHKRQRAQSYPSDNPRQALPLLELPHHSQESSKTDINGESSTKESSMV